jgi:hypothetical protein
VLTWPRLEAVTVGIKAVTVASPKDVMERRLVIRPYPWRQLPVVLMIVAATVVGVSVWAVSAPTGDNLGFGVALSLVWGIYILESVWIRLIVTSKDVRFISSHRDRPVSRDQVGHIRALRCNTAFYDHDGKRILETRADLSRTQLLALANELGVNVWDHRAWHGLKKLKHGVRLNPEPSAHHPPA